jgi:hypothetical protein
MTRMRARRNKNNKNNAPLRSRLGRKRSQLFQAPNYPQHQVLQQTPPPSRMRLQSRSPPGNASPPCASPAPPRLHAASCRRRRSAPAFRRVQIKDAKEARNNFQDAAFDLRKKTFGCAAPPAMEQREEDTVSDVISAAFFGQNLAECSAQPNIRTAQSRCGFGRCAVS